MADPQGGWFRRRRYGRRRFAPSVAHAFAAVHHQPDSLGLTLTIASAPSACGRVKTGAILDATGPGTPAAACRRCLARLGR